MANARDSSQTHNEDQEDQVATPTTALLAKVPCEAYGTWLARLSKFAPQRLNDAPVCAICFEAIEVQNRVKNLHCFHLFHCACLQEAMRHGLSRCPICGRSLCRGSEMVRDNMGGNE